MTNEPIPQVPAPPKEPVFSDPAAFSVRGQLFWLVASVILVSGTVLGLLLMQLRSQAISTGERMTESVAYIVAEQTDNALHAIDLRMQLAMSALARLKVTGAERDLAAFHLMQQEIRGFPFVRSLSVANAQGQIVYTSEGLGLSASVLDREYFKAHFAHPDLGFHVGPMVRGRLSGDWLLTASRPMKTATGAFDGVIVAAINPTYFDELWREVHLGDFGSIALFRLDGVLMMRSPVDETVLGKSFASNPFFTGQAAAAPSGTFRDSSPIDGRRRQLAYRTLPGNQSLMVIVGQLMELVLAPWRQLAAIAGFTWLAASLSVSVLGMFLGRAWRERMDSDARVQEIAQRLTMATETSSIGVWDWDLKKDRWYATPTYFALLGRDPARGMGREEWLDQIHPEDRECVATDIQSTLGGAASSYRQEIRVLHSDGAYRWVNVIGHVLMRDEAGHPSRLLGVMTDVTERRGADEVLRKSVQEKEALLQEVHHRVKNNLQVITSLLRLETRRSSEKGTKVVLEDMQARIRSMALLHETLYRKGDFAKVDLGYYLRQLATQLFRAHNADPSAVRLVLNLSGFQIAMQDAIPCGLLVNELLTNSLKHAFPAGHSGEVKVSLEAAGPGRVRLEVSDTGVGLSADFESRRKTSLGLQLVSDLAGQLGGELEVGAGPQAVFAVAFDADEARPAHPDLSPRPSP